MIPQEEANKFLKTKEIEKPNLGKLIDYDSAYNNKIDKRA